MTGTTGNEHERYALILSARWWRPLEGLDLRPIVIGCQHAKGIVHGGKYPALVFEYVVRQTTSEAVTTRMELRPDLKDDAGVRSVND